jgi:osmotically-inducible protein OsmY
MKTDRQLKQGVLAELQWESSIDAAHIGVAVENGLVTLHGRASSFAEKWDAERAVQRVAGVQGIAVEIDVHLPGDLTRSDADIADAANHAISWQIYLPKHSVHVLVENSHVTLTGAVPWHYQRELAVAAVRYLMGVTGVSNQILLVPNVSLNSGKADVEEAVKRHAYLDEKKVLVQVSGSEITLTGAVPNWAARIMARDAAWNTPGVRSVADRMTIS